MPTAHGLDKCVLVMARRYCREMTEPGPQLANDPCAQCGSTVQLVLRTPRVSDMPGEHYDRVCATNASHVAG